MKVIANDTLSLRATLTGPPMLEAELEVYKGSLYEIKWHDEISKEDVRETYEKWKSKHPSEVCPFMLPMQKSYIDIIKIPDVTDRLSCRKLEEYKLELTKEQFEEWFSPIEEHSKLHFHRINLSSGMTDKDRCDKVNKFIHDANIKIDKVFEPNSNTIDIWYTKYVGNW